MSDQNGAATEVHQGLHQGNLLVRMRTERGVSTHGLAGAAGLDHQRIDLLERESEFTIPDQTRLGILDALHRVKPVDAADREAFLRVQPAPPPVHAPAPAEVEAKPQRVPPELPKSYTHFGILLRGLRMERRIPIAEMAVLAVMPEECIEAAEIAGPIAGHLTERILKALHAHTPLSAEQIEIYRDLAGIGELPAHLPGRRANDREPGVGPRLLCHCAVCGQFTPGAMCGRCPSEQRGTPASFAAGKKTIEELYRALDEAGAVTSKIRNEIFDLAIPAQAGGMGPGGHTVTEEGAAGLLRRLRLVLDYVRGWALDDPTRRVEVKVIHTAKRVRAIDVVA